MGLVGKSNHLRLNYSGKSLQGPSDSHDACFGITLDQLEDPSFFLVMVIIIDACSNCPLIH